MFNIILKNYMKNAIPATLSQQLTKAEKKPNTPAYQIKKQKKEQTFETIVPESASTCRNFGVLGNAHTKRVQLEFQSG